MTKGRVCVQLRSSVCLKTITLPHSSKHKLVDAASECHGAAQGLAANPEAPYRASHEQSVPVLRPHLLKAEADAHSHTET